MDTSKTDARLTGKRCGCPTCGEIFSTESNFMRHRKGDHGVNRHCVDPESVGLVIAETATGKLWRMPGMEA